MDGANFQSSIGRAWPEDGAKLTAPELIRLEHFAAPPQLQPFVTTLFSLRCVERTINDMLPAAVGYLAITLEGSGSLRFADGLFEPAASEVLLAPTNAAVELRVDGPLALVVAALSPLGWAALTRLDASKHVDRADPAATVLGADVCLLGERMRERAKEGRGDEALANLLAEFIAARLGPVNQRHAELLKCVADWLSGSLDPALADLQRSAGYSPRQLERLVMRYFGCGPKQLARKYRALRVAALMHAPDTSDERVAGLYNLFYDQSHLIREIRRFMGRTPLRLAEESETVLQSAISLRNYHEFRPNVARMPDD